MGIITTAKIKEKSIVIYSKSDKKRTVSEKSKENLIQNKEQEDRGYNGEISVQAQRQVKSIIENWSYTLQDQAKKSRKRHNRRRKLTFVTLTLSSPQEHDDKEVKRKLLDSFLIYAQRKWNVKHYVWKAELQANGNIHFHIVWDSYVHYERIKYKWNEIQEKLGYISKFEAKHGHKDPNSTDVKSIKCTKTASIYIAKYITKKEKYKDLRKLDGRVWGCSDSLKKLKYYEIQVNYSYWENHETFNETNWNFLSILDELRKMDKDYYFVQINEYAEVHCFERNAIDLYRAWDFKEWEKINKMYKNYFQELYEN